MFYLIIYLLLYPFFLLLSFFRKNPSSSLVIQTAKIGDYTNSSVIFNKLSGFDIIINKINYNFSSQDNRINRIYITNDYNKSIKEKVKLAFILFWNNYENIYVLTPNSFNLFLAQMNFAKNVTTIYHYNTKWYEEVLMVGIKKVNCTYNDLTVKSYLSMINEVDIEKNWKKIQDPLFIPVKNIINSTKFKVGISLTAGNKIKTIDFDTWQKILTFLDIYNLEIYIFGLKNEQKYLDIFLKLNTKNKIISLLDKTPLKELPFYLSQMDLYISSDTGNSYIADSFRVPVISLAGPCCMDEQRPIGEEVLVIDSNVSCVPFSFVFKTSNVSKYNHLYSLSKSQEETIKKFMQQIYV